MDKAELNELKKKGKTLKTVITIGKEGIAQNTITHIKNHLKANKICKIKLSKQFLDGQDKNRRTIAQEIAHKLEATLIDQVGFVLVLWKR